MPRIPNRYGGGSLTNAHGLLFEQTTSLNAALNNEGFRLSTDGSVCDSKGLVLGYSKSNHGFIRFLEDNRVDLSVNSDILLPDDAFINTRIKTVFIIEKKFQNVAGSVDEKLQTCLYKTRQYHKLVSQMNYGIEYTYVLSDWFKQKRYRDVLEYIVDVGCSYFFNELPLEFLGL